MINIILVSTGILQEYIVDNIKQLLKFNFKIHVITESKFFNVLDQFPTVHKINSDDLMGNFESKSGLDKGFRDGFWHNCSKRLFLLYNCMKTHDIKNVIHLENDVLLYDNLDYVFENKVYLTMDHENRCIPGIIYIPTFDLLTNLITNYNYDKNDMINMAKFYHANRDIVTTFPIIDNSIASSMYNENFSKFNSIFDAAAIGQYLGGVDPRNIKGNTVGFVNETCVIKFNNYAFEWVNSIPHIKIKNRLIRINNLHIHCKNLKKFSIENKLDIIFNNFFNKQTSKTVHETLANYSNNTLIPGGDNGLFYTHICYHTIYNALLELTKQNKDHYNIVETGCSAHGTKSTLLWDKFVNKFGGKVLSVDLNKEAVDSTNIKTSDRTKVTHSNSLDYLPTITDKIDFLYLDSYDVDFLDPLPSAEHHLKEFNCIKHLLREGSIVLIDDTPVSPEWLDNGKCSPIYGKLKSQFDENMAGKGSLVCKELEKMGATKIIHQYQILWKIT